MMPVTFLMEVIVTRLNVVVIPMTINFGGVIVEVARVVVGTLVVTMAIDRSAAEVRVVPAITVSWT